MIRVGVIHIGSSKIRLILAEVEEMGYFKVIDELKTPFKICYELSKECILCSEKLNYILSTIKTYKSLCEASGAKEIFAITTSFFNDLKDSESIVSMIKLNLNLDLKILSQEEEIKFTVLAVNRSMKLSNSLIVEITGTSTNLIDVKDGKINNFAILPFGGINLAYTFNINDRILNTNLDISSSYVKDKLDDISWLNNDYESIIFLGDLAKTIFKMDKFKTHYPLEIINNYEITPVGIHEIYNTIKCKDLKLRRKIDGIDLDMVDSMFSSLLILNELVKMVSPEIIRICNNTIREGILYDYLYKNYNVMDDILDYSIYGILNSLNSNITHAEQVYFISAQLFEELKPLHRLDDKYLNILKTGSMLHDCGTSINYQNHHKHSFYIILNSLINELTHKEHLMSAAVAASHRFNDYHLPLAQFSYLINKLDIDIINKLGALVKIAEGLDRSLVGVVKKLNVYYDDEKVIITVSSPSNLDVEIHQALRGKNFFKEIYHRDLFIEKERWQN
ncbi:Ppx/GppA phosphatase family protein [Clostridium sp. 1001271B_151109_B4]|uniref:Ppx/GppA phosphatase family protein n=1 Tax=Clostridium sp. 1001271B_151109_B4 TaxID=2787148 RepID=UPI0018A91EC0|nr:Ppx/GppA phosphatase family protein [Clostridium sp. 1001271B_151109_B4]